MKKSKATEALRVASNVAALKAALHQRGYRLRKQPKQPVWKVIVSPDHFHLLANYVSYTHFVKTDACKAQQYDT